MNMNKFDIPEAPDWILKFSRSKTKTAKNCNAEQVKETIESGARNTTLTHWAGKLRAQGLEFNEILSAIIQINLDRCAIPLEESEVETIAKSVSRYPVSTANAHLDFLDEEIENISPIKVNDLVGIPPKREWLIEDWLPLGEISSLYGSGGTGKSLLALQIAFGVATGTNVLSLITAKKMPVLAVFCEDSKDEIHRRYYAIKNDFIDDSDIPLPGYAIDASLR